MGWGCYRHEVDAESENWNAQIDALLPDGASHGKPFNFGRDRQVCPFCWEEMEKIQKIYGKALVDIVNYPEGARQIATDAFKEVEKIEQCPMDTDPEPQRKSI